MRWFKRKKTAPASTPEYLAPAPPVIAPWALERTMDSEESAWIQAIMEAVAQQTNSRLMSIRALDPGKQIALLAVSSLLAQEKSGTHMRLRKIEPLKGAAT